MLYYSTDLIARHAVLALCVIVAVALAFSIVLWRAARTLGPRSWSLALDLWNAIRRTAIAERLRRTPLLERLLTGTLTAARYLGLVAVLGFMIAAAATALFFELAQEIGVDESLAKFDTALADALRRHVSLDTLRVFSFITHLGDVGFLAVLVALVFLVLVARREIVSASAWLVATASGGLLNRALKAIFERSRPIHDHGLTSETGWSFPSGHASGSMLVYGLLAYLIVRHAPARWHIPVVLMGVTVIIFVGSSRVLLQVHYLSDVLAGYGSAGAWLAICIGALEAIRWRQPQASRYSNTQQSVT
jgi:membrane-associated phospholipid phosphatase